MIYLPTSSSVRFVDLTWLRLIVYMIGRTFSSANFAILYIFTPECNPTEVRNLGMSTASTAARVTALFSPYIAALVSINP
mgnify:CR=1 FL=1